MARQISVFGYYPRDMPFVQALDYLGLPVATHDKCLCHANDETRLGWMVEESSAVLVRRVYLDMLHKKGERLLCLKKIIEITERYPGTTFYIPFERGIPSVELELQNLSNVKGIKGKGLALYYANPAGYVAANPPKA